MNDQLPPLKKPEHSKLKPIKKPGSLGPIIAGVAIAGLGLAAAAALLIMLLSKPEPEAPSVPFDPGNGADRSGKARDAVDPKAGQGPAGRDRPSLPRLIRYPSIYWSAKLPSSAGWSRPESTVQGSLDRTELRGPDGSILIIDYTAAERPSPANVVSREPAYVGDNAEAEVVKVRGGDICPAGTTCTDYLLPVGSGGYAVLAGWPGREATAEKLARAVANSLIPTSGGFD